MEENLVGYLLGALDPEATREVEKYLDEEPTARQRLEVLRRALAPLAADKDTIDPPAGLTIRTLARVAEYRCRPLPQAPPPPPARLAPAVGRPWWRRGDVLAAACLLIAVGGLGITWVAHQRAESQKIACQENLKNWHFALAAYAEQNDKQLPKLDRKNPRAVAASFAPMLHDAGVLPEKPADRPSIRCPANGPRHHDYPSFAELADPDKTSDEDFQRKIRQQPGCYAYSLGYLDKEGEHHALRLVSDVYNSSVIPVMADCPSISGPGNQERGPSANHNGHNILFAGGNVRFNRSSAVTDLPIQFCKTPYNPYDGKDHIYLNKHGKVAAGAEPWDAVLGVHEDRP